METDKEKELREMSKEDYQQLRLEKITPEDKADMEDVIRANPGLTPEKYMEMVIAYGF